MKRIYFSYGRAAKYDGDPCLDTARYGFNWWLWIPYLHWNGGRLNRSEVMDISASWLCFWVGLTIYPKWIHYDAASANNITNSPPIDNL